MNLIDKFRDKMFQLFPPKITSPVPLSQDFVNGTGRENYKWNQVLQKIDANKPSPSQATPTQAPIKRVPTSQLEKIIKQGLDKYAKGTPIATASGALAKAGADLPDPYLPTIVSLLESSGGRNITRGSYNAFNILPTRAGVNYSDYPTAILGGGDKKGFRGVIKSGLYDKYLKSGRPEDFFATYSPPSENAPLNTQVARYRELRKYFE